MKLTCIAVDDEPLALEKLTGFIRELDLLELRGAFTDPLQALSFLKQQPVDLLFLDIRMKKLSGLQFIEALHVRPKVIITSAYDSYALQGFELDVSDYLLKPFSFERFLKAVDKVYTDRPPALPAAPWNTDKRYIFVKTEYRIEKVETSEILYIEGMNDYLRLVTATKNVMTIQTFSGMAELLPAGDFCRVHKSYIVALDKMESIERNRIKIGEHLLPIGNSYAEAFYQLLRSKGVFR